MKGSRELEAGEKKTEPPEKSQARQGKEKKGKKGFYFYHNINISIVNHGSDGDSNQQSHDGAVDRGPEEKGGRPALELFFIPK